MEGGVGLVPSCPQMFLITNTWGRTISFSPRGWESSTPQPHRDPDAGAHELQHLPHRPSPTTRPVGSAVPGSTVRPARTAAGGTPGATPVPPASTTSTAEAPRPGEVSPVVGGEGQNHLLTRETSPTLARPSPSSSSRT